MTLEYRVTAFKLNSRAYSSDWEFVTKSGVLLQYLLAHLEKCAVFITPHNCVLYTHAVV